MLDCTERLACIRGIFELAGGKIETRKKLHKLVYLFQELGIELDQDFTFHHYGVFSPTLANDLRIASERDSGLLKMEYIANSGYVYELNEVCEDTLENTEKLSAPEVNKILSKLMSEPPQYLEVLSTIVYLYRNHYRGERLVAKLRELKPDLDDYFEKAFQQAEEIYEFSVTDDV